MGFGAAANGSQSPEVAVGTHPTRTVARVLADTVNTGRASTGTVTIAVALGPALGVGAADVSSWTLAHGPMVARDFAVGSLSTLVAGIDALVAGTMLLVATLRIVLTLVTTARDGVALDGYKEGDWGNDQELNYLLTQYWIQLMVW